MVPCCNMFASCSVGHLRFVDRVPSDISALWIVFRAKLLPCCILFGRSFPHGGPRWRCVAPYRLVSVYGLFVSMTPWYHVATCLHRVPSDISALWIVFRRTSPLCGSCSVRNFYHVASCSGGAFRMVDPVGGVLRRTDLSRCMDFLFR